MEQLFSSLALAKERQAQIRREVEIIRLASRSERVKRLPLVLRSLLLLFI
jgi:hypothetical protein